jgi:hypothetical protein
VAVELPVAVADVRRDELWCRSKLNLLDAAFRGIGHAAGELRTGCL